MRRRSASQSRTRKPHAPEGAAQTRRSILGGALTRRERWGLEPRGWFALLILLMAASFWFIQNLYPFLAPREPVDSSVLVIEGFLSDEGYRQVAREYLARPGAKVYVVGGPLDQGSYLSEYQTLARVGAETLKKLGVPAADVVEVAAPRTRRDRTFASALALRRYFDERRLSVESFNLYSPGSHARRSRLLYQLAFEDGASVGILPLDEGAFEASQWWRSSAGFRTVLGELIAYPYALFFKWTHGAEPEDG